MNLLAIAAKAVAFRIAATERIRVSTGGTDVHLVLVDLREFPPRHGPTPARSSGMIIAVLVKYVPDATGARTFTAADSTVDRGGAGLLSELDEYAVEQAILVTEANGGEVVAITVGAAEAAEALKKALQMGADRAVHILDDALHGSDAPATSLAIAETITKLGNVELIITGMASTDAAMSVVPAMVAERLGLPHIGSVVEFSQADGQATARRDVGAATETVTAALPAVISVTDQSGEPRYPSFKGIMAAKKKQVDTWGLADLGVAPDAVGLSNAWTSVVAITRQPPRAKGEIVTDSGGGAAQLTRFLTSHQFI